MYHITKIRIELVPEVITNCDIKTEEDSEKFKRNIIQDLARHNVKAKVELTMREMQFCQHTEKTLRQFVGRMVHTRAGNGKLLEAKEGESGPVTDIIKIKTTKGRVMIIPAGSVDEVMPEGYCDHYFPATGSGYLPCEFCGEPHPSNNQTGINETTDKKEK